MLLAASIAVTGKNLRFEFQGLNSPAVGLGGLVFTASLIAFLNLRIDLPRSWSAGWLLWKLGFSLVGRMAQLDEIFQGAAVHIGDGPIVHSRFCPVNYVVAPLTGNSFRR
jgi:hypothetical protein